MSRDVQTTYRDDQRIVSGYFLKPVHAFANKRQTSVHLFNILEWFLCPCIRTKRKPAMVDSHKFWNKIDYTITRLKGKIIKDFTNRKIQKEQKILTSNNNKITQTTKAKWKLLP